MHATGIEGEMVFYVLEEHHFTDQNYYAMLDSLLASGEVAVQNCCSSASYSISFLHRSPVYTLMKKWKQFYHR